MSVQTALSELPSSIRVGGYDMRFNLSRSISGGMYGACDVDRCIIYLSHDMLTTQHVVDTLLHEVSHAVYRYGYLEDTDVEERIVSTFATSWMQVFRDNPWLTKWIAKHVK